MRALATGRRRRASPRRRPRTTSWSSIGKQRGRGSGLERPLSARDRPPFLVFSNLAVALAGAWGDGDGGGADRQKQRRRTADQARQAAVERAAVGAAPKRGKKRRLAAAPDPTPDQLTADRVRAVLATADVDRTTLRDVVSRVALEGGGQGGDLPRAVVQAAVDDVLAGGGGGGDGAGALLGGWPAAAAATTAARAVPAGLAGDALAPYLDLRDDNPAAWTLTVDDELSLPATDTCGDISLQAALAVAAALRARGAPAAAAQAGARAAHATACGLLNEAWTASRRQGRGAVEVWGGLFRPPKFLPETMGGGGGGDSGDAAVEPRPVKGGVDVPTKASPAKREAWAPRASAAFGAVAPSRTPAAESPPSVLDPISADGGAGAVFDWAARSGVRAGVVLAAAARLRGRVGEGR